MSSESTSRVVVTDVHMPFWSMVTFMVKWAFAAIPAMIILIVVGFVMTAALGGALGGLQRTWHTSSEPQAEPVPYTVQDGLTKPEAQTHVPTYADRCKGNPEPEKCMALEKRLAEETPEQRKARQSALEAAREAAMTQVK